MTPSADEARRFADSLGALIGDSDRLGIAVSGGPDSLALLLLAHAVRPDRIAAATVDHRLRPESAAEARMVAELCQRLGVPHRILPIDWAGDPPTANIQAQARDARYAALADWAVAEGLAALATAHHADDQAETLLMRLARGAGLSGLAATRRRREIAPGVALVRPLLGWRKAELAALARRAGLEPVDDPANRDPRHDRTRARALLGASDWADPMRLAASAHWLAEADEALDWALAGLVGTRLKTGDGEVTVDPWGVPRELQRRLLLAAMAGLDAPTPKGPELARALDALGEGRTVTLAGLKLEGGPRWRLTRAPKRR